MKDITYEVETREKPRVPNKSVRDELWYNEHRIGYLEAQGPVFDDPHYQTRFVPNRYGWQEQRIYQLKDYELAPEKTG